MTTPDPSDDHEAPARSMGTAGLVVDFEATGRRLRRMTIGSAGLALVLIVAFAVAPGVSLSWRLVGETIGWVLLATILGEVAITSASALAGLLRAGERGDRLAGSDVALLPPQVRRRRR